MITPTEATVCCPWNWIVDDDDDASPLAPYFSVNTLNGELQNMRQNGLPHAQSAPLA